MVTACLKVTGPVKKGDLLGRPVNGVLKRVKYTTENGGPVAQALADVMWDSETKHWVVQARIL